MKPKSRSISSEAAPKDRIMQAKQEGVRSGQALKPENSQTLCKEIKGATEDSLQCSEAEPTGGKCYHRHSHLTGEDTEVRPHGKEEPTVTCVSVSLVLASQSHL